LVLYQYLWALSSLFFREETSPELIIRIKDDLLGLLEKEIDRSQMNASGIVRKALSEYLDKRE